MLQRQIHEENIPLQKHNQDKSTENSISELADLEKKEVAFLQKMYNETKNKNEEDKIAFVKSQISDKNKANDILNFFKKVDKKFDELKSTNEDSTNALNKAFKNLYEENKDTSKDYIKQMATIFPGGAMLNLLDQEFDLYKKSANTWKTFKENAEKKKTDKKNLSDEELVTSIITQQTKSLKDKIFGNKFVKMISDALSLTKLNVQDKDLEKQIKEQNDKLDKANANNQDLATEAKIRQEKQDKVQQDQINAIENVSDAINNQDKTVVVEKDKNKDKSWLGSLGTMLVGLFKKGPIGAFFSTLFGSTLVKNIGSVLGKGAGLLGLGSGGKIAGLLGKGAGLLGSVGKFLGPLGLGISALAGGTLGYNNAGKYFNKKQEDTTTSEKISSVVGGALEGLTFGLLDGKFVANLTNEFLSAFSDGLGFLWKNIKEMGTNMFSWVSNKVSNYFKSLYSFFVKPVTDYISNALSPIKNALKWIWDKLSGLSDLHINAWKDSFNFIWKELGKLGDLVVSYISEPIKKVFKDIGNWFDDKIKAIIAPIKSLLGIKDSITNAAGRVKDKVINGAKKVWDKVAFWRDTPKKEANAKVNIKKEAKEKSLDDWYIEQSNKQSDRSNAIITKAISNRDETKVSTPMINKSKRIPLSTYEKAKNIIVKNNERKNLRNETQIEPMIITQNQQSTPMVIQEKQKKVSDTDLLLMNTIFLK